MKILLLRLADKRPIPVPKLVSKPGFARFLNQGAHFLGHKKPMDRLVHFSYMCHHTSTLCLSTWSSIRDLMGKTYLEASFALNMLSALIYSAHSYSAMPLVRQLIHQRYVHKGPLVLPANPLNFPDVHSGYKPNCLTHVWLWEKTTSFLIARRICKSRILRLLFFPNCKFLWEMNSQKILFENWACLIQYYYWRGLYLHPWSKVY